MQRSQHGAMPRIGWLKVVVARLAQFSHAMHLIFWVVVVFFFMGGMVKS
jgi:hypothetical protein